VPDLETRDDREVLRTRLALSEQQTQIKTQIQTLQTAWSGKAFGSGNDPEQAIPALA